MSVLLFFIGLLLGIIAGAVSIYIYLDKSGKIGDGGKK